MLYFGLFLYILKTRTAAIYPCFVSDARVLLDSCSFSLPSALQQMKCEDVMSVLTTLLPTAVSFTAKVKWSNANNRGSFMKYLTRALRARNVL